MCSNAKIHITPDQNRPTSKKNYQGKGTYLAEYICYHMEIPDYSPAEYVVSRRILCSQISYGIMEKIQMLHFIVTVSRRYGTVETIFWGGGQLICDSLIIIK
jgi:hypothetical protein